MAYNVNGVVSIEQGYGRYAPCTWLPTAPMHRCEAGRAVIQGYRCRRDARRSRDPQTYLAGLLRTCSKYHHRVRVRDFIKPVIRPPAGMSGLPVAETNMLPQATQRSHYQPGALCYIFGLIFFVVGSSLFSSVTVTQLAQQHIHASSKWGYRHNPWSLHFSSDANVTAGVHSAPLVRDQGTPGQQPAQQQQQGEQIVSSGIAAEQQHAAQQWREELELWQLLQDAKAEVAASQGRVQNSNEQQQRGEPVWQQKLRIDIRHHQP